MPKITIELSDEAYDWFKSTVADGGNAELALMEIINGGGDPFDIDSVWAVDIPAEMKAPAHG